MTSTFFNTHTHILAIFGITIMLSSIASSFQVPVNGFKNRVFVEVFATETVEQFTISMLIIIREAILGYVVERIGPDPFVQVSSQVSFGGYVGCPNL